MGKHEIRLRRKMMTSRRIERHKNYAGLMKQHHKTQRTRTIVRWVVFILIFLMSMILIFKSLDKNVKRTNEAKIESQIKENNKLEELKPPRIQYM